MSDTSRGGRPGGRADAIVVAAGRSSRMNGIDKILTPLGGRPLLAWTLHGMAASPEVDRIVVVTAADVVESVRGASWLPEAVGAVVAGGGRRQESVAAGFAALEALTQEAPAGRASHGSVPRSRVVLIHDGARPALSVSLIRDVVDAAQQHGAAIPTLPIGETVKRIEAGCVVETVDRSTLALAQTPQGVLRDVLHAAYRRFPPDGPVEFTDEAALLEACRIAVHVVPGDPGNLKVTVPADLPRVAATLALPEVRIGSGMDSHPFGPAAGLVLGGVQLPGAPRLHGHSDGDAALHALADALLGAAALGDLGQMFPADDRTPPGVDSRELLAAVVQRLRDQGFRPASADLTIVAARPRLSPHLDRMRSIVAQVLGIDRLLVNVKASTGNLAGDEGAGRGISAYAVVTVEVIR